MPGKHRRSLRVVPAPLSLTAGLSLTAPGRFVLDEHPPQTTLPSVPLDLPSLMEAPFPKMFRALLPGGQPKRIHPPTFSPKHFPIGFHFSMPRSDFPWKGFSVRVFSCTYRMLTALPHTTGRLSRTFGLAQRRPSPVSTPKSIMMFFPKGIGVVVHAGY